MWRSIRDRDHARVDRAARPCPRVSVTRRRGPGASFRGVVNRDAAATLLYGLMQRLRHFGLLRPRLLACVPTDVSAEERDAVFDSLSQVGAAAISVVPEPLAAQSARPGRLLSLCATGGRHRSRRYRLRRDPFQRSHCHPGGALCLRRPSGCGRSAGHATLRPGAAPRRGRPAGASGGRGVPAGCAERIHINGRAGSLGVRVAVDVDDVAMPWRR